MPTPAFDTAALLSPLLAVTPDAAAFAPPQVFDVLVRAASPFTGRGRIAGTVKVKGTPDFPKYARVRLVRELDAICVEEVWSNGVTAEYEFAGWDETQKYTVIAYDPNGLFRATLASGVTPEVTA